MAKRLSVAQIIQTDYYAFAALVTPLVLWGMYIVSLIFQQQLLVRYTAIVVAISLAFILALAARLWLFYSVFTQGVEASATISQVVFFRSRYSSTGYGSIQFKYQFNGQEFDSSTQILKTQRTEALMSGDRVVVLIDTNHPARAFIRDLYV